MGVAALVLYLSCTKSSESVSQIAMADTSRATHTELSSRI